MAAVTGMLQSTAVLRSNGRMHLSAAADSGARQREFWCSSSLARNFAGEAAAAGDAHGVRPHLAPSYHAARGRPQGPYDKHN